MREQDKQPTIAETLRLLNQTEPYVVRTPVETSNHPISPQYRTPNGLRYFLNLKRLPKLLVDDQFPYSEEEARKRFIDEMNI